MDWMLVLEITVTVVVMLGLYGFMVYHKSAQFALRVPDEAKKFARGFEKRFALLSDLVAVMGENKVEATTLIKEAINARAKASKTRSYGERIDAENMFSGALARLMLACEGQGALEKDPWYLDTIELLRVVNEEMDQTAKQYNGVVKSYNDLIDTHPSKLFIKWKKYPVAPYFITNQDQFDTAKATQSASV